MFQARLSLSCLLSAALVATGCSNPSASKDAPRGAVASQALAPSAASVDNEEPAPDEMDGRTFEQIPSPGELLSLAREALGERYDEKVAVEVEQELSQYHYTPSDEPEPESDPGEPQGGVSFLEDATRATEQVAASFNQRVEVRCAVRPCITRGDFDGDGGDDLAVQVTERGEFRTGIALLVNDTRHLLAAGSKSEAGEDLLWLDTWRVVPSAKGLPMEGEALGAVLLLDGADQHAAVYLVRGEKESTTLKVYRSDKGLAQ